MNNNKTLHTLLISGMLCLGACNDAQQNKATDITDSLKAKTDTAMQDVKQGAQNAVAEVKNAIDGNADSNFVVKATIANNEELMLLKAGLDNGTSKEVKAHAKMMMADHKALGAGVKAYAAGKNYPIPVTDNGGADDAITELNKNSKGADWDKAWVNKLANKHQDAIDMFEKEQDKVKDPALKDMITGALPKLHSHLEMLKQMQ